MFLKKIFLTATIIFTLMIFQSANAKDLYVESWYKDGSHYNTVIDLDSLEYGVNKDGWLKGGRWFNITLKIVKDGNFIDKLKYNYHEFPKSEWRYSHDKQRTNNTWHVTRHNKLFYFMMHYIGWKYDDSIFWD